MILEILRKFLNIRHVIATETIPIIIRQPELFVGILDIGIVMKALSNQVVYGYEQRIEFMVDFINTHTLDKYWDSMFLKCEAPSDTIATVDLVSYGIQMEKGNCVYTEQISTENLRFVQGENSPTNPCIDFFCPKGKNRKRIIISLLSNNSFYSLNAYLYMLKHENRDKAWQFILTLKDNSDPDFPKPCIVKTQVFKLDTSDSQHKFIILEQAKSVNN